MTQTVKFSQFLVGGNTQEGDIVVGLRNGQNYQFNATNGGGGATTATIVQPAHGLSVRQWVTINTSGLYVPGLGDSAQDAEIVGVVIQVIDVNTFVVQQAGKIETASGVFTGLTPGFVYFLDTVTPGNMVPVDALVNGQVSRPLFFTDSAGSGWVLPYRGLIVGGAAPPSSNGNGNLVNVTQIGHGLNPGDVVRIQGSIDYVKAQGNTFNNSQAVGVVITKVNANQFVLQTNGYYTNSPTSNTGPFSVDDVGADLIPGIPYYLSPTFAGKITSINPTTGSLSSKPIYIGEQVWGTTGTNAGFILEQRPLTTNGNVYLGQLNLGNNFSSTTILSDYPANVYLLIITGEIYATAGAPTYLAFQMYSSGSFINSGTGYQMSGVFKNIPITGTLFSAVDLGAPIPPGAVFFPPIYKDPACNTATINLQINTPGLAEMLYTENCYQFSTHLSYSITGATSCVYAGTPTGIRLFAGAGVPLSGTGYVSVYAIPNS